VTTLTIPKFEQQIIDEKNTNKQWYFFLQGLWKGTPPASESAVTVTTSPMTYVATQRGFMVLSGGTVSAIAFSRNGTTFYTSGEVAGSFPLSNGDSLRVTYTVVPTMTFFPQ
jgi:hypothetical protein